MVTEITYERLYNLGDFQNMRLTATAIVEDGNVEAAWNEARQTVEDQYAQFQAERAEAARRAREEAEDRQRQARARWEAEQQRLADERAAPGTYEPEPWVDGADDDLEDEDGF